MITLHFPQLFDHGLHRRPQQRHFWLYKIHGRIRKKKILPPRGEQKYSRHIAQLPATRRLPHCHNRHLITIINHTSTGLLPSSLPKEPSLTDYLMRLGTRLRGFHKHAPKYQGCSRNRAGLQTVSKVLQRSCKALPSSPAQVRISCFEAGVRIKVC